MMNHTFTTADTTMLDVYYTLTEGCSLPVMPVCGIWNTFAPRKADKARKTGRKSR